MFSLCYRAFVRPLTDEMFLLLSLVFAGRPRHLLGCHQPLEPAFVHGYHAFRPTGQVHKFREHGVCRLLASQERAGRLPDRAGRGVE